MKSLILVVLSLQILSFDAHADISSDIQACNSVTMALLAKDNYPYWADDAAPKAQVLVCYDLLKDAAINASPEQKNQLMSALNGNSKIFHDDKEFAQFLKEHRPSQQQMVLHIPKSAKLTPAIKPAGTK